MRGEESEFDFMLSDALLGIKYLRLKRFIYRAAWSNIDIEHFIYFSRYGNRKQFLSADYGMRHVAAENFALDCVRDWGRELFRRLKHNAQTDCKMRFSLGKLAGWSPRWSLHIHEMPMIELVQRIGYDVRTYLVPAIGSVTNDEKFLSLLISNSEPHPWYCVNGAIRGAQIADLAGRLGIESKVVFQIILPFEREISISLPSQVIASQYNDFIVRKGCCESDS